jgi:hypothetical protein
VHPVHGETVPAQSGPYGFADHRVVFNEQESHDPLYPTGTRPDSRSFS